MKMLLLLMQLSQFFNNTDADFEMLSQFGTNKRVPARIERNVLRALSYYPELKSTPIDFIFKSKIKTSVMQAQPVFGTLLLRRSKRRYRINISVEFRLAHSAMPIESIPDDVMIGWIGHELGHILDYESKSNPEMMAFGYQYVFSPEYVKKAEIIADTLAVNHGLGKFIICTKRFILDHADIPQAYKNKISRLYLSPDVIVEQVRKLEEKAIAANKPGL